MTGPAPAAPSSGRRGSPTLLLAGVALLIGGAFALDRALQRGALDKEVLASDALASDASASDAYDLVDDVQTARVVLLRRDRPDGAAPNPRTAHGLTGGPAPAVDGRRFRRALRFDEGSRVEFAVRLPDVAPRLVASLMVDPDDHAARPVTLVVRLRDAGGARIVLARHRLRAAETDAPPDVVDLDVDVSFSRGTPVAIEFEAAPPLDGRPLRLLVADPAVRGDRRPAAPAPASSDASRALRERLAGRSVVLLGLGGVGADELTAYGAAEEEAETLDVIARDGITFEATVGAGPGPAGSIESLMTGRWPADPERRAPTRAPLAERLQEHGFVTAAFVPGTLADPGGAYERGFDVIARHDAGSGLSSDAVVEWLAGRPPATPSFLWLQIDRTESLRAVDAVARAVLETLAVRGFLDDSILVVVGTHGRAQGGAPFGAAVEVPWIVRLPTDVGWAPSRVPGPSALADVAPTLLSWLGVTAPTDSNVGFDGVDLTPRLFGATPDERPLFLRAEAPTPRLAVRAFGHSFQVDLVTHEEALFELTSDRPLERPLGPHGDLFAELLRPLLARRYAGPTGARSDGSVPFVPTPLVRRPPAEPAD